MRMTTDANETSVTFSLAELAKLEEQRIAEQEARATHEKRAREQRARDAQAAAREAELERIAKDTEARKKRERAEAEERTRLEARRQAEIDVARIQAESKARLEADNAARAHELELERARTASGSATIQRGLAAALGLCVLAGGLALFSSSQRVDALQRDLAELQSGRATLIEQQKQALGAELATLDQRLASALREPAAGAEDTRAAAENLRNAIDPKSPDATKLAALTVALDQLAARRAKLAELATLEHRHADLSAWATERRQKDVLDKVDDARARAKAGLDDPSLGRYQAALDAARDRLAEVKQVGGGRVPVTKESTGPRCTDKYDPLCGLDGKSIQ